MARVLRLLAAVALLIGLFAVPAQADDESVRS